MNCGAARCLYFPVSARALRNRHWRPRPAASRLLPLASQATPSWMVKQAYASRPMTWMPSRERLSRRQTIVMSSSGWGSMHVHSWNDSSPGTTTGRECLGGMGKPNAKRGNERDANDQLPRLNDQGSPNDEMTNDEP